MHVPNLVSGLTPPAAKIVFVRSTDDISGAEWLDPLISSTLTVKTREDATSIFKAFYQNTLQNDVNADRVQVVNDLATRFGDHFLDSGTLVLPKVTKYLRQYPSQPEEAVENVGILLSE